MATAASGGLSTWCTGAESFATPDIRHSAPWVAQSEQPPQVSPPRQNSHPSAFDFKWLRGSTDQGMGPQRSYAPFEPPIATETRCGSTLSDFIMPSMPPPPPVAPDWLRDLRAFAESEVRDSVGDFAGLTSVNVPGSGFDVNRLGSAGSDTRRGSGSDGGNGLGASSRTGDTCGLSGAASAARRESEREHHVQGIYGDDLERDGVLPRRPFDGLDSGVIGGTSCAGIGRAWELKSSMPDAGIGGSPKKEPEREWGRAARTSEPPSRARRSWLDDLEALSKDCSWNIDGLSKPSTVWRSDNPERDPSVRPSWDRRSFAPREQLDSLPCSDNEDDGNVEQEHAHGWAPCHERGGAADLDAISAEWQCSFSRLEGMEFLQQQQQQQQDLPQLQQQWRLQEPPPPPVPLRPSQRIAPPWKEDLHNWHDDLSCRYSSGVWDPPTPQRAGYPTTSTVAESLEPSPMNSRAGSLESSRASSCSVDRADVQMSPPQARQGLPRNMASQAVKRSVRISQVSQGSPRRTLSQGSSRDPSLSPRERSFRASKSPPTSSPREGRVCDQASLLSCPLAPPASLVPCAELGRSSAKTVPRRPTGLLTRRHSTLGALQTEGTESTLSAEKSRRIRQHVPRTWRAPMQMCGGCLERSELGSEVTAEVRLWLLGETSGPQCSQVVLDRALTVLANFKLASGCQLEVLGGPLGAIVGGYSDADWLHDEVFKKQPTHAICEAFQLLGLRGRGDGDWSNVQTEEVSLAYRRLCLRGHPSRGGAPRGYLKLQVAMELIRAFAGEAGPLEPGSRTPRAKERTPTPMAAADEETPATRLRNALGRFGCTDQFAGFVLNDITLVRELQLTAQQAEEEAAKIPQEQLEEMNRALDEYILRQMCFKSEIVDEIARLHEDCAYAILGVSSDATDTEIKKAYRVIAMQCHPDKGGDKEDFQELNNAYEKIMEQRRSTTDPFGKTSPDHSDNEQSGGEEQKAEKKPRSAEKEKRPKRDENNSSEGNDNNNGNTEGESGEEDLDEGDGENEYCEGGSNASIVEKAGKAAEEASRYAKTAAEFAHQAAEAAETARRGREQGSRDTLTKSISHSAIVLTLTVVKAVRVVGYATLDVAAQCRIGAKRNPTAVGCAERAVTAMSLGLEALNAALACAEVTETTAAELQAPTSTGPEDGSGSSSTAAAERFVGAAVRASLAAASASNAAMSAAIAAVEGSRECAKAVEAKSISKDEKTEDARTPEEREEDAEATEADAVNAPEPKVPTPKPTPEEVAAAAARRLVAQRNNNHKVLQRLNAEILGHQQNVKQFLQTNRQLIPDVTGEAKRKVFGLLSDYAAEVRLELDGLICAANGGDESASMEELLSVIQEQPMLVPFAQEQSVAIPVSVKARVLKMAALYDYPLAIQVIEDEIFTPVKSGLGADSSDLKKELDRIFARMQEDLKCNASESSTAAV